MNQSKETLNSPNGGDQNPRFLHSGNHRANSPFSNKDSDIPDHIIQKKENVGYLVKWTHLYYDNLTWEKKVDKSLLALFNSRKSSQFPNKLLPSDNYFPNELYFPAKFSNFYEDLEFPPDIIEEIKFLFNAVPYDNVTISEIDNNFRSILSTSAFIHCLAQKIGDFGPFLIIVDQREYNDWYDFLNKSKELTTLAYNGPVQSRKIINEIDFIDSDGITLHFHILITTPHILESDIDYLQQIEWKLAFVHFFNDSSYSNAMKLLDKLRIVRKIVFKPLDKKTVIPKAQEINAAFESGTLKDMTDSKACENFFQFIQKAKISTSSKVDTTYFYIVECPMNDIQKKVCKYLLSKYISKKSPEKSNFFIIAQLFYLVIQHPFLIPGIESKLLNENVLLSSTKMRVMRRIIYDTQIEIEETDSIPNILICTQIPEMFRIIKDYIDDTYSEESNIQVFLEKESKPLSKSSSSNFNSSSNPSNSNLNAYNQISFKTIDVVIIYDGKIKHWEKLLETKISQSTRIYKLEALDSREIEIGRSPSPTDQEICKIISFQIMIPSGKISPRDLLDENISFDMFMSDPHSSSFAVNAFAGDDYWQKFVNTSDFTLFKSILDSEKPANSDVNISINVNLRKRVIKNLNDKEIITSLYQRRQFVRAIISFGWGNYDKIINSIGFELNEDMCKKLCLTVFSLIKYEIDKKVKNKKEKKIKNEKRIILDFNFISNLYRDYLLQNKIDNVIISKQSYLNPNNFKEKLREDRFLLTNELPFDFFEHIFQLSCLSHFFGSSLYNENDINDFDFTFLKSSKPDSWWTEEHDKALLFGMWKYGYNNYIPFLMKDPESDNSYERLLQEIICSNISLRILNKRENDLLSFITSYIMNDLRMKSNNIQKTLPNWTDEEQELVISYILSFGINFNSSKEINEIAYQMVNEENKIEVETEKEKEDESQKEEKTEIKTEEKEEEEVKKEEEVDVFSHYHLSDKTKDSVADFLNLIRKEITKPSPDEGGLSYITSLRIKIRIFAMRFLHNYVQHITQDRLCFFYAYIPQWIIGNYKISYELEHIFISEIEKRGFGKLSSILADPVFKEIKDIQILACMKDEYRVILRIFLISQIVVKNDLFANEPTVDEDEFEKLFGISLPISIANASLIHSFGKIDPSKPNFYNDRYIYPIGFKSSRLSISLSNSNQKTRWYSEIINVNDAPVFRVWQEGSDIFFEGPTTTSAWVKALMASKHVNYVSISGPEYFLLTHPIVTYFIQKLPGASLCKSYIMRNIDSNPTVVQFLKTNSLMASSNDDASDSNAN